MDRMRRKSGVIAWVAGLAVLANALALVCCPIMPSQAAAAEASPFGPMVICTGQGLQVLNADGQAVPAGPDRQSCAHCAAGCATAAILALLLAALLVGPAWRLRFQKPLAAPALPAFVRSGFQSRAPPLPA
jgi:hypothetical protein